MTVHPPDMFPEPHRLPLPWAQRVREGKLAPVCPVWVQLGQQSARCTMLSAHLELTVAQRAAARHDTRINIPLHAACTVGGLPTWKAKFAECSVTTTTPHCSPGSRRGNAQLSPHSSRTTMSRRGRKCSQSVYPLFRS